MHLRCDEKLRADPPEMERLGAANVAPSALSLGAALNIRESVAHLEKQLPEVQSECLLFLSTLEKLVSENRHGMTQHAMHEELSKLKGRFENLRRRCNDMISEAKVKKDGSTAKAWVSGGAVVLGAIGLWFGVPPKLASPAVGHGVRGVGLSVENIKRCNTLICNISEQVDLFTSEYRQSVEKVDL